MLKYSVLKNIYKFTIALSWDFNESETTDLDVFGLLLNADNQLASPEYLVFYDNLWSSDGAVQHTGDNLTGKGESWDEVIKGYLDLIEPEIQSIMVGVSVHDEKDKATFKLFKRARINLDLGDATDPILVSLNNTYADYKNLVLGHFTRSDGSWTFRFDLEGSKEGFQDFVKPFFIEESDFKTYKMRKL